MSFRRATVWVLAFILPAPMLVAEDSAKPDEPLNWIEQTDLHVRQFTLSHHSGPADAVFGAAHWLGDWRVYLGITAAFYAAGEDEFGELAIKAGAISGVATESLRFVVGRERPRRSDSPETYSLEGKSFPSGHSSTAFAMATALDETYGVGYVTYPLASLTALSRIYHDGHWLSDTLMGAGIGIASAKAVALHDEDGVEFERSAGVFAEAFGAFTVADLMATRIENGPGRTALRVAAIGFAASRVEEEQDIYAAFAGVATSLLLTRGLKKFRQLHFTPSSVSFAWEW